MTGGMAFVLDLHDRFDKMVNPDSVVFQRLAAAHWEQTLIDLITEHARETGSSFADELLRDWDRNRRAFWQICPKEMVSRLKHPLSDELVAETA
jgi:glutamate synthase (NADPH/NADH) large chain